jgi:hypothetical protein
MHAYNATASDESESCIDYNAFQLNASQKSRSQLLADLLCITIPPIGRYDVTVL